MNIEQVIKKHIEIFPEANINSQLEHLNEEISELESAETLQDEIDELGDVLFVAISLMRFELTKKIGEVLTLMYKDMYGDLCNFAVEKAIIKVESRTYIFDGEKYTRNKGDKNELKRI